jgi:YihY family inner membrane protein
MIGHLRKSSSGILGFLHGAGRTTWRALCIYSDTDGEQRAASFAYYAFFALFPLILLFVSIGSLVVDKTEVANSVIGFVSRYIPVGGDGENAVMKTINGVVASWKGAGAIALLAIIWSALGLFHAIVRGVNRAWGTLEYPWWKLPFKNLFMVGIVASALFIGVIAPAIMDAVEAFTWRQRIPFGVETLIVIFRLTRLLLPSVILFYGFAMFYKFAPRRRTTFAEIWIAAFTVTILLQILQGLFVQYVKLFPNFNRVYGAFSGVVVLLMWIYLSGSVIIFGGCLSAAQAELRKRDEAPCPEPEKVADGKD